MSACKDMNYCRESEAECRHNTKKRVKKSFKHFLQMASKIETGLDSHRSRLLPYWHLYMKQTYQYILKGYTALHNEGNLVVRFVYSN